MLITHPQRLQETLKGIRPTHVAVAYLGAAWKDYLDLSLLEEIIVSPTLGSNPDALLELLALGRDRDLKVYFLENLHAKLYIGIEGCLIGSANLTDNGFGGGLEEAAVMVPGQQMREQALAKFARLREHAVADERQQRHLVAALRDRWNQALWRDLVPNECGRPRPENGAPSLTDFQPGAQRIHVVWYVARAIGYDDEAIRAAVPEIPQGPPDSYFRDAMCFAKDDHIKVGDWLLCWACNNDGLPRKNGKISWMQVHLLIPGGASEESEGDYTLVAAALRQYHSMPEPFLLDGPVKRSIRRLLSSGRYPALVHLDENEVWRANDTAHQVLGLLEELKQAYRDERLAD